MAKTTSTITPRAPILSACTCIWRSLEEKREHDTGKSPSHPEEPAPHSTIATQVKAALTSIPSVLITKNGSDENLHGAPEDMPSTAPARKESQVAPVPGIYRSQPSAMTIGHHNDHNPLLVNPKTGLIIDTPKDSQTLTAKRTATKSDILKKRGWASKKKSFKLFGMSLDQKIAELISYREDLVHLLDTLIPSRRTHDPHSTHPPIITPVPRTPLCATCQQTLAHALYYTPPTKTTFIREMSTVAFLGLVDDATASLEAEVPMEFVTHAEVDSVLRRELAVVEWGIAVQLAKLHKKTEFLTEFPVRLGEYGEFQVNVKPPGGSEGFVKKAGKKVLGVVGLQTAAGPSGEVQATED